MATKSGRRIWSTSKKQAVIAEVQTSLGNGGTIQSVLEKHRISHGMYKRWVDALEDLTPTPETPSAASSPAVPTITDALQKLRLERDRLLTVIHELERMANEYTADRRH